MSNKRCAKLMAALADDVLLLGNGDCNDLNKEYEAQLNEAERRGIEMAIAHCESTDLPMEIVLKETKKAYGVRVITALMDELREKFLSDSSIDVEGL